MSIYEREEWNEPLVHLDWEESEDDELDLDGD